MEWKPIRTLLAAALALLPLGALGGIAFIKSGLFNVAASKPHTKFTTWANDEMKTHSIKRHGSGNALPARAGAADVLAGFCAYETHCVACHGAAGVPRQAWASGMEPSPPYLLDTTEHFTPPQLFWVIKNGIKMTGMPSWRNVMTDAEIVQLVAWLEASAKLPPQTYVRWRSERLCGGLRPRPAPGPLSTPPA